MTKQKPPPSRYPRQTWRQWCLGVLILLAMAAVLAWLLQGVGGCL